MFERLEAHAGRAAAARAAERMTALAGQLREILPNDVAVEATDAGVFLSGGGLGRTMMLDLSLRWTIAGLLK